MVLCSNSGVSAVWSCVQTVVLVQYGPVFKQWCGCQVWRFRRAHRCWWRRLHTKHRNWESALKADWKKNSMNPRQLRRLVSVQPDWHSTIWAVPPLLVTAWGRKTHFVAAKSTTWPQKVLHGPQKYDVAAKCTTWPQKVLCAAKPTSWSQKVLHGRKTTSLPQNVLRGGRKKILRGLKMH